MTPEIAEAMDLDNDAVAGALIAQVNADTPAETAGLAAGDVITAVDGTEIEKMRDVPRLIAAHRPGETVTVTILRDGGEQTLPVKLGKLPTQQVASVTDTERGGIQGKGELGLALAPITPDLAKMYGWTPMRKAWSSPRWTQPALPPNGACVKATSSSKLMAKRSRIRET